MSVSPSWQPSTKFMDAFEWACELHTLDVRKGSNIPYIGHLLGVASSVIEAGGSENQAMAAFLHDSVEDTSTSIEQIAERINREVADIVAACTDATATEKNDESKLRDSLSRGEYGRLWWRERKKPYIKALKAKTMDDPSVLVALADKTYNAENTAADLRGLNEADRAKVWSKFNADEKFQMKWYLGLLRAFRKKKIYDTRSEPLFRRFEAAVNEMFPIEER